MANCSVIGSGGWGTALAILLQRAGHNVTLWSWQQEETEKLSADKENKAFLPGVTIPSGIKFTSSLEEAAEEADLLMLTLPSVRTRAYAQLLAPLVKSGQLVVNGAKGIESGTGMRISQILQEYMPYARIVALSGPSHAEEVARGIPTAVVAASEDTDAANTVQDIFMTEDFRVYTSSDVIGVELGGAVKNVIALCAGMVDGLGFGDNTKAALATRGLHEIMRLGIAMGADAGTFGGLSGIGDLIVTCTSVHSRNHRAGVLIGKGMSMQQAIDEVQMVVEGVPAAKSTFELAQKMSVSMPITEQAYRVLYEGKDPRTAVLELMRRSKKSEREI